MSTSTPRILRRISPALFASALCLAASAFADNPLPTITVQAPAITKTTVGHTAIGTPIEQVTVTYRVSYKDLDLTTVAGATTLKSRVKDAARSACDQIRQLYPLEESNPADCVAQAVADSSPQINQAISAARPMRKAAE